MRAANAIRKLIVDDSALFATLGQRVRVGHAGPVDARPYCLIYEIFTQPENALDGDTGFDTTTVQVDVYADNHATAGPLARNIQTRLTGFHRGNVAETFVHSLMRSDGPRQSDERIGSGSADLIARVSTDYRVHHSER